jgi:hypothetical protein
MVKFKHGLIRYAVMKGGHTFPLKCPKCAYPFADMSRIEHCFAEMRCGKCDYFIEREVLFYNIRKESRKVVAQVKKLMRDYESTTVKE